MTTCIRPLILPLFLFADGLPASGFGGEHSGQGSRSAAGVSMAADLPPMGTSQRNRLLELNIEYRDRMIYLKVNSRRSLNSQKSVDTLVTRVE